MSEGDVVPRLSRRGFLKLLVGAAAETAILTKSTPEPQPKETGIIQTGIREIVVDGRKYQINVNPNKLKEVAIAQAEQTASQFHLSPDDANQKIQEWLEKNSLEFQVFGFRENPFIPPQAESYFTPPELNFLSNRAKIGVRVDLLPDLVRFSIGDGVDEELAMEPLVAISHETANLVSYIDSPQRWKEEAEALKLFFRNSLITDGLSGLFLIGGLKLLKDKMQGRKRFQAILGATMTTASALSLCGNLLAQGIITSMLIGRGLEADTLYQNSFNDKITQGRIKFDADYRHLVLGMLEFSPIAAKK